MKTIEIVSHCYAERLPHYAAALCYQLSGFILHPPRGCKAWVTVCYDPTDGRTSQVLDWFTRNCTSWDSRSVCCIKLPADKLGRRSIGRNFAAKDSRADLVWFADVDQVFHGECLDALAAMEWPEQEGRVASMVFPRHLKISRDHATGNALTAKVLERPAVVDVDPAEFTDKTYNVAIGGVQIIRGVDARRYGYLDGDPYWQQPRTDGLPFKEFRDDLQFRKICNRRGPIVGIELPGLYRIRHLETTHR